MEPLCEVGAVEGGVRVPIRVLALAEDPRDRLPVQSRMELGAPGPLDAVRRPLSSTFGKGDVMRWVPVATGDDQRSSLGHLVDGTEDCVSTRYRERSTRAEVDLGIDDQHR